MRCISRTRVVGHDPLRVWEQLADFAGISSWAGEIAHSAALTSPDCGPGAARRVQIGRAALRERIVVWEPPERLSYTVEGLPSVAGRVTSTWTLAAEGGGTRVTLTCQTSARPPLLARAVAHRLARSAECLLDDLSQHCSRQEAAR